MRMNVVAYIKTNHCSNSVVHFNRDIWHLCLSGFCYFFQKLFDRVCFVLVAIGSTERTQSTTSKIVVIKPFFLAR